MNIKYTLTIIILMIVIIGGIYYFISPYQNCLRNIDKKLEEVRNKLSTETDVNKRDELELEQGSLINQRKSDCMERSGW